MIKNILIIFFSIIISYVSFAGCTVGAVYLLNESLEHTDSMNLYPN